VWKMTLLWWYPPAMKDAAKTTQRGNLETQLQVRRHNISMTHYHDVGDKTPMAFTVSTEEPANVLNRVSRIVSEEVGL
jgi:hypothetical protein